ncbi:MAG: hypothetical protein ABEN55_03605, partial [Bradymonadaceae bacterium]
PQRRDQPAHGGARAAARRCLVPPRSGDDEAAERVLERRNQLLERLKVTRDDPRHLENAVTLAHTRVHLGGVPDAERAPLEETKTRLQRQGLDELAARASLVTAFFANTMGEYERTRVGYEEAISHAREADATTELMRALLGRGWLKIVRENLEGAEPYLIETRRRSDEAEDRFHTCHCQYQLAWLALFRGQLSRAKQLFETVRETSREAGYRVVESNSLNSLGDLARLAGDAERARSYITARTDAGYATRIGPRGWPFRS